MLYLMLNDLLEVAINVRFMFNSLHEEMPFDFIFDNLSSKLYLII